MPQKTFTNFRDLKNYMESSPSSSIDDSLLKSMIEKGRLMDVDIFTEIKLLQKQYSSQPLFNNAIISSLIWSGHAIDSPQYYASGIKYLHSGKESYLENAIRKCGRYGGDNLKQVLKSWLTILKNFENIDFAKIRSDKIFVLQENLWNITFKLVNENKIRGIGNWLLFAPFKIVIAYRNKLWENKIIDQIKMPLGLEVIRGIKKLIKKRSKYLDGFDTYMFYEQEKGFLEDKTVVELVHNISKRIANDYDTRVIHVNSGLYLLGKGEL